MLDDFILKWYFFKNHITSHNEAKCSKEKKTLDFCNLEKELGFVCVLNKFLSEEISIFFFFYKLFIISNSAHFPMLAGIFTCSACLLCLAMSTSEDWYLIRCKNSACVGQASPLFYNYDTVQILWTENYVDYFSLEYSQKLQQKQQRLWPWLALSNSKSTSARALCQPSITHVCNTGTEEPKRGTRQTRTLVLNTAL